LERITVNDVMVPRNQIEALDINAGANELRQQIITCHHTLLPVYADTQSDIIGILHLKRVPALLQEPAFDADQLRECLTSPISSHPTRRCSSNCSSFRSAMRAWVGGG